MDYPAPARSRPDERRAQRRYLALAVMVGIIAGTIGSMFHLAINALLQWPAQLRQIVDGPLLVLAAALITMTVTVAAVALVRHWAPEASGSGVQEVEGAMDGLREIHWTRVLPIKFFAGAAAIGSGLVLGREGPTIHIGASVAAMVSARFGLTATERSGLLAAGAAAGLACAFNSPIAAVLFVIEEMRRQFPYRYSTYMGVIIAALLATVVTQWIGGAAPDLVLAAPEVPLPMLPLFVLLGCVLGGVGVALNACILKALAFAGAAQERAPYLYPAVVGLLVGALLALSPQTVTGGEALIPALVREQPGVVVLLALAAARFCTTVGSYSTGVPGGIFAPILSLAGCVGLAFAALASAAMPDAGVVPAAFAIAAMGGLFTASVRAPMVGVVLTLELTGAYGATVPLLTTCLAANLAAQWLGGRPIYEQLLERTLTLAGIKAPAKPANDG
ncbi:MULTISPECIES: H(+)/Cl(-) exchange transporter ClcA [unclassified Devosia]|uniref:H(+)/Cl(-) exchange transporter ClcA n=1 Tax=unclassified Devosia TaxID=196773 RepID=UPI0015527F14|nr:MULTISPECIES: H(+)/Cl(-) exchange transporter ClcA [unclassified Devosia]